MRLYVDLDNQHFVVFEATSKHRPCPICGTPQGRTIGRRAMFVRGDRNAEEATWNVLKDQPLDRMPSFDAAEKAAREFVE